MSTDKMVLQQQNNTNNPQVSNVINTNILLDLVIQSKQGSQPKVIHLGPFNVRNIKDKK